MIRLLISFILILPALVSQSQLVIPELKHTVNEKDISQDTFLLRLRSENQVVLLYRAYSVWNWGKELTILAYDNCGNWNDYTIPKKDRRTNKEHELMLPDSIMKIWNAFLSNDMFSIKDEKDLKDACIADISDAQWYDIRILTKTAYKRLKYYCPEFFEHICPGSEERQKVIRCAHMAFGHEMKFE